jgi:hypothetical protein
MDDENAPVQWQDIVKKLKAERDALAAKVVKLEGTINDADPAHKRCRARVTALKAENAKLRELLELAYDWVPQTDKPLLSKIEAALKTEEE